MKALFDSILLNRLQMESNSNEVTLDCTVFEHGNQYETEFVLSGSSMNQLLNELACREIELDFEHNCDEITLPDGTTVYHMNLEAGQANPIFLPLYVMPEKLRLLRA